MAYIDKIHLSKKDIPAFYEYMQSIDTDFKKYFRNAGSILDYTYYYCQSTPELLADWTVDDDIPVSNFPEMIDRWLAHREDLPDIIRDELTYQYGNSIFNEPIYVENPEPMSHKFKIIKATPCEGRVFNIPVTFWSIDPRINNSNDKRVNYYRYYIKQNKFVDNRYVTPDLIGYDYWIGSSSYRFKSMKAVFRYLRKHGFPKGTEVRIYDWRWRISTVTVKFI